MRFPILKNLILVFITCLLSFTYGCTTPSKGGGGEGADTSDEEDAAALAAEDAAGGSQQEEDSLSDSDEAEKPAGDLAETPAAPAPEEAAPAPEAAPVPEAAPAPVSAMPMPMMDTTDRVVRYVVADGTPAFSQADDKSQQVATYEAGDPLVVKLMGDWAELTDNYYVKSNALSPKIVPRKRANAWSVTTTLPH